VLILVLFLIIIKKVLEVKTEIGNGVSSVARLAASLAVWWCGENLSAM